MAKNRLTSIETLPDTVIGDAQWLYDTIIAQRMSQVEMLADFNARMKAAGQPLASMSGLNRYVIKVREGAVRRPQHILGDQAGRPSLIFQEPFRNELLKKQGLHAMLALEAALAALVGAAER